MKQFMYLALPLAAIACQWNPATEGLGDVPDVVGTVEEPTAIDVFPDGSLLLDAELWMDGEPVGDTIMMPSVVTGHTDVQVRLPGLEHLDAYRIKVLDARTCDQADIDSALPMLVLFTSTEPDAGIDAEHFFTDDVGYLFAHSVLPLGTVPFDGHPLVVFDMNDSPVACGVLKAAR